MSDVSFQQLLTRIIDSATFMKAEAPNLKEAIRTGYSGSLKEQINGIVSSCRALENLLQENVPNGSYSVDLSDSDIQEIIKPKSRNKT